MELATSKSVMEQRRDICIVMVARLVKFHKLAEIEGMCAGEGECVGSQQCLARVLR